MLFLCSGKCKKLFEILYRQISVGCDKFNFYEDGMNLICAAIKEKSDSALILVDYELYKGFIDTIYDILKSQNLKIPLILIDDPRHDTSERVNYWISINEFKYDIQTLHLLAPLFTKISEALELPAIKKLILEYSQDETPELVNFVPAKTCNLNLLSDFPQKNCLTPTIYSLLSFFYQNRCREVSIDEIASYMGINAQNDKSRRNAVYAYLARLRKFIERDSLGQVELLRTRTGYYKLFLR